MISYQVDLAETSRQQIILPRVKRSKLEEAGLQQQLVVMQFIMLDVEKDTDSFKRCLNLNPSLIHIFYFNFTPIC